MKCCHNEENPKKWDFLVTEPVLWNLLAPLLGSHLLGWRGAFGCKYLWLLHGLNAAYQTEVRVLLPAAEPAFDSGHSHHWYVAPRSFSTSECGPQAFKEGSPP